MSGQGVRVARSVQLVQARPGGCPLLAGVSARRDDPRYLRTAITSISTRAPFGNAATWTVERAGRALGNRLPETSFTAAESFQSPREMLACTTLAKPAPAAASPA